MTHIVNVNKEVPLLRFREFEGIWTREKFKGLVKINQGLQIPISERYTEEVDNSYFYITNEFLKAKSDKKYYIKNPNKSVLCDVDDILMTRTGNTGMVVTNVKGAFHNNFFKIAYPSTIDKDFLFYFLNLTNTQNTIKRLAGTSTIPDLNHSDFYRIDFPITTLPEQQKIASFLSAVDEKLQQLSKKKNLLEEYKKGVMKQIFSQELRFKDDNGNNYPDWEEKKLGDISRISIGEFVIRTKQSPDYNYPVYNGGKSHTGFYDSYNNEGDKIIISARGANAGFVNYEKGRYWAGNSCYSVDIINKNINNVLFMYSYIKHKQYLFTHFQQAANIPSVSKKDAQVFKIICPIFEEQKKIANFLSSLDSKIDLVSIQIENTKVFKKGLLQQMFV